MFARKGYFVSGPAVKEIWSPFRARLICPTDHPERLHKSFIVNSALRDSSFSRFPYASFFGHFSPSATLRDDIKSYCPCRSSLQGRNETWNPKLVNLNGSHAYCSANWHCACVWCRKPCVKCIDSGGIQTMVFRGVFKRWVDFHCQRWKFRQSKWQGLLV